MSILGVIPNDRLDDYERGGIGSWLAAYYNPQGFFDRVYCLSPLERRREERFGMVVIPTRPHQLSRWVRQLGVNVLRGYGGSHPAEVLAAAGNTGVPVVISVHDSDPKTLSEGIRVADLVLCTSGVVAELVKARGIPESAVRILPNRVDLRLFSPDAGDPEIALLRCRFPWRYPLLHVGRRARQKNLETVLAALPHLGAEYGLLSVGQGDAGPYKELAQHLGVANRCAFLDRLANTALPSYLRWCSCLCVPSRWEGFGIVFIEAMACGAVVVTSAIAPMTEFIQDGVDGVLVENFEDPRAIASAVARACEGPDLVAIRHAAREASRRFGCETVDALEVSLYREALALGCGRRGRVGPPSLWERMRGALTW